MANTQLLAAMALEERRELAGVEMISVVGSGVVIALGARPSSQMRPCGQTASQKLWARLLASQCGTRFTRAKPSGRTSG